jgi:sporulation protein YlmC with PRC-barrel domain
MSKPYLSCVIALAGLLSGALASAQQEEERPQPPTSETTTGAAQSNLVGAEVVSQSDAPIGKVVDVVVDAKNQPTFVVIDTGGKATAVPFQVASAMQSENKIVMDRSRLLAAPKIRQGEWRESGSWKQKAERYWNRS